MKVFCLLSLLGCVATALFGVYVFIHALVFNEGYVYAQVDFFHEGWLEVVVLIVISIGGILGIRAIYKRGNLL